ncbi:hypothetical protein [Nonlabens sp. YIK11]|nr:hypothetical protein [Nonlabens sp. YIK11]
MKKKLRDLPRWYRICRIYILDFANLFWPYGSPDDGFTDQFLNGRKKDK